jgi:hypothetical protein
LLAKHRVAKREILDWLKSQPQAPEVEFKYEQQQQTRGAVGVTNRERARKKNER